MLETSALSSRSACWSKNSLDSCHQVLWLKSRCFKQMWDYILQGPQCWTALLNSLTAEIILVGINQGACNSSFNMQPSVRGIGSMVGVGLLRILKTPLAVVFTHSPGRVILELNAESDDQWIFVLRSACFMYNDKYVLIWFVSTIRTHIKATKYCSHSIFHPGMVGYHGLNWGFWDISFPEECQSIP